MPKEEQTMEDATESGSAEEKEACMKDKGSLPVCTYLGQIEGMNGLKCSNQHPNNQGGKRVNKAQPPKGVLCRAPR